MIAAQLYTTRLACERDFLSTLDSIKELGFDGVEFAGFYGHTASEIKSRLKVLKLEAVSSHVILDDLKENLEDVIDYHKAIECHNIVCPYANWTNDSEFKAVIKDLARIGVLLKEAGMTLHYHNHEHEFKEKSVGYDLDELISESEIRLEFDVCWAAYAGVDPVVYYKKNRDHVDLIHLKDLGTGEAFMPLALGQGYIDIKGLIAETNSHVVWYIVENDHPKPDGLTNLKESMAYLIKENIR